MNILTNEPLNKRTILTNEPLNKRTVGLMNFRIIDTRLMEKYIFTHINLDPVYFVHINPTLKKKACFI